MPIVHGHGSVLNLPYELGLLASTVKVPISFPFEVSPHWQCVTPPQGWDVRDRLSLSQEVAFHLSRVRHERLAIAPFDSAGIPGKDRSLAVKKQNSLLLRAIGNYLYSDSIDEA